MPSSPVPVDAITGVGRNAWVSSYGRGKFAPTVMTYRPAARVLSVTCSRVADLLSSAVRMGDKVNRPAAVTSRAALAGGGN